MFDSFINFFYELVLYVDLFFCKVLSILYSFFDIFAGVKNVSFDGIEKPLINVFFDDTPAKRIYAYMAGIGIAICFAFTIYAVIKKIFDIDDKIKNSLGGILGNLFKSILFILLMNFVILITLRSTNELMERVIDVFNNESSEYANQKPITFDNGQYATMARVINTIGNYSVNSSYNSRYNINTCYNEIRRDMLELYNQGVFRHSYDSTKEAASSWQYYLAKIANAHNLAQEQNIDEYDETLTAAITSCMEQIWFNNSFAPIEEYSSNVEKIKSDETPFDALIFLAGTSHAAKNEQYNKNPDIFDSLRYDYIKANGKSIYDIRQVKVDFDISFGSFDHLAIIIMGVVLGKVFLALCINCAARIFNLMLLYLIAPMFIAVTPLDDGEKTKQWATAFIVQAFSVFGAVFGIRILMIFVTMIFNSNLILFSDATMNFMAKLLMVFAISIAIEQASKIVTGILANNAGFQSIQASDVGSAGANQALGTAKMLGGKAFGLAKGTLGAAGTILNHTPLGTAKNLIASKFSNGLGGYLTGTGVGSKAGFDRQAEKQRDKAERQKEKEEEEKKAKEEAAKKAQEGGASAAGGTPTNNSNLADGGGGNATNNPPDAGGTPTNNSNLNEGGGGDASGGSPDAGEMPTNNNNLNENGGGDASGGPSDASGGGSGFSMSHTDGFGLNNKPGYNNNSLSSSRANEFSMNATSPSNSGSGSGQNNKNIGGGGSAAQPKRRATLPNKISNNNKTSSTARRNTVSYRKK